MQLIDHALLAPNGCMICGADGSPNQQLLDLLHDFSPMRLRLYLCRNHGRDVARAFGYAGGEEQEGLMNVRGELKSLENQHTQLQGRFEKLRGDMQRMLAAYDEKEADLEREMQRSAQLQEQLDEVRRATTATLDAVAPPPEPVMANSQNDNQGRRTVEPALD